VIAPAVLLLAGLTSTAVACALLGKPRASHYRDREPVPIAPAQRTPRATPSNALSECGPGGEASQSGEAHTGLPSPGRAGHRSWLGPGPVTDRGVVLAVAASVGAGVQWPAEGRGARGDGTAGEVQVSGGGSGVGAGAGRGEGCPRAHQHQNDACDGPGARAFTQTHDADQEPEDRDQEQPRCERGQRAVKTPGTTTNSTH
jgi:hypothetical protein